VREETLDFEVKNQQRDEEDKGIGKDIGESLEMSHPSLGIPGMAEH
jgi:hypothetical protein